jgi:hypothetical protein
MAGRGRIGFISVPKLAVSVSRHAHWENYYGPFPGGWFSFSHLENQKWILAPYEKLSPPACRFIIWVGDLFL